MRKRLIIALIALLLAIPIRASAAGATHWLQFPDGTRLPIVEAPLAGNTWDVSKLGSKLAGHLSGTALPGEGNTVLGGHTPGPFAVLRGLMAGDILTVIWAGEVYTYQVLDTQLVTVSHIEVTATPNDQYSYLTLLTCDGNLRLVVRAIQVVS